MTHPVLHCTGQGKSLIKHVDLMAAYDAATDADRQVFPALNLPRAEVERCLVKYDRLLRK